MRAITIHEPGDVSHLRLDDIERPTPGPGQVLIRVGAAGVCYRDVIDRQGKYPFMKRPVVTGHEFAGEVVALGPSVTAFAIGDRVVNMHRPPCGECEACRAGEETRCSLSPYVFGITVDGGYAEFVAAHVGALVRLPAAIPFDEAAFLHCTAGVALRGLRSRAALVAGETVLITGASGGVGIHAIQVAHILGARVVAVTGSAAKVDALRAAGADEVVVTSDGAPFHAEVQRRLGGAHVALELVGAPTFNSSLRSLRAGGRLVVIGNITTERVEINLGRVITQEAAIFGSATATPRDLVEILGWVEAGKLRPVVAARLPLEEAQQAQRRLEEKGVIGRIVLVP